MQMIIRGLVHADTPTEALTDAKHEIFLPLVHRGTFDAYATFDASGTRVADPEAGTYPVVARADSLAGQTLVDEGWDATVDAYETSFEKVQDFLANQEVSDFWTDGAVHRQYHHAFHKIGEYEGPRTYLYDEAGQGIRDHDHLDLIFDSYEALVDEDLANPYRDRDLYVVPAAVEY
jgi:hypothetical protein